MSNGMMIDQFLNYLQYERNKSSNTLHTYEEALGEFESYFKTRDEGLSWATVDADLIRDWMESLMDKGNFATTINKKLSALRSFYRFALARELVGHDPAHTVRGPKKNKPLPQFATEKEMNYLLDSMNWDNSYKDIRARTIIILLYEGGLRRSELTGLNDDDVDFGKRQLKVTGKRNKQRLVPFGEEVERQLTSYMEVRNRELGTQGGGALLLNSKGGRISGQQVYDVVRHYLTLTTALKKRSPHVLRHSFATAMLNNGAGLESVQKLLGHESLETTQIYTHTTFEQLKRIYKEAHPRA